jgi:hypothetical protein
VRTDFWKVMVNWDRLSAGCCRHSRTLWTFTGILRCAHRPISMSANTGRWPRDTSEPKPSWWWTWRTVALSTTHHAVRGNFNQFKEEFSKRENVPHCMRSMLTDEILINHVSILNDQWHTFHRGVEAENRRLCELS